MDELTKQILKLWLIPGLGPKKVVQLLETDVNLKRIDTYEKEHFYSLGIDQKTTRKIKDPGLPDRLAEEIAEIKKREISLVHFRQKHYPSLLKGIYDFPPILYYLGQLPDDSSLKIAVVGSRKASSYGKSQTKKIIKELAEFDANITIVSGLAYGIDTVAHQAALENNLKTIAVLGSGLGNLYPKPNTNLAQKIVAQGSAIISEFSVPTIPHPRNFPIRNRIISGLSQAVLVMEAPFKSGALGTAKSAIEQSREVFALPGAVDSYSYEGCNWLIQQGAGLLTKARDLLESLYILPINDKKTTIDSQTKENLNELEKQTLQLLQIEPLVLDQIAYQLKKSASEVMSLILSLEVKGHLREESTGRYVAIVKK